MFTTAPLYSLCVSLHVHACVFILLRTGLLSNPAFDLPGLDAPLQQYPTSAWHLSGMDLLQLTSKDLEILGVNKIGHQELILEAVEKLCFLVSGSAVVCILCITLASSTLLLFAQANRSSQSAHHFNLITSICPTFTADPLLAAAK